MVKDILAIFSEKAHWSKASSYQLNLYVTKFYQLIVDYYKVLMCRNFALFMFSNS